MKDKFEILVAPKGEETTILYARDEQELDMLVNASRRLKPNAYIAVNPIK